MKRVRSGLVALAAIMTGGVVAGCSSIGTGGGSSGKLPRGGEPTVAQKRAEAEARQEVKPVHASLGSADLDPHTVTHLTNVGGVDVYKTAPFHAVLFEGGLQVDADGSPIAYHPRPGSSKGLDNIRNAGSPGEWWGIVTDNGSESGTPVIQQASDPAPGFYVSSTSLEDPNYGRTDPRRYVNASTVPFFVLPVGNYFGGSVGDIAAIVNFSNGKVAYAIAADTGPKNKLGEGSVALAKALGVNPSARSGGTGSGIGYCMFPGSGNQRPQSVQKINAIGKELFADFGGIPELRKHLKR